MTITTHTSIPRTPPRSALQKIVILGATSGIALEVERRLARYGLEMMLVARSSERLAALQSDLLARGAKQVLICAADLSSIQSQEKIYDFVRHSFPEYDTVLLAYGSMQEQKDCEESVDRLVDELNTNFVSASAILTLFAADLERRRTGCIAAITSVAGDRGRRSNYVYGAAKGALSLFLQGLRSRLHSAGVKVITIKPGPVMTPMTDHLPKGDRFADPQLVARDIVRALDRRSPDILYAPWYWRHIMRAVRQIPETLFKRMAF